jgi:hypothetical protein
MIVRNEFGFPIGMNYEDRLALGSSQFPEKTDTDAYDIDEYVRTSIQSLKEETFEGDVSAIEFSGYIPLPEKRK